MARRSPEERPLAGRVAVVTGGARGIGRGIAVRLARDGAHCVITYRRQADAAHEVVEAIERAGVKGLALPLELAEPAAVGPVSSGSATRSAGSTSSSRAPPPPPSGRCSSRRRTMSG